ncbi:MAG: AAA family ATPase [Candidatus Thermoplasmatota archaeon]|nr:AAA family ATPase [Candidatus Thermoplasmatota archaeon]
MLIKSLELKNFLSHRETTLYFDSGINMIVGHNGAGKTTILDAIKFAMFGKDRARLSNPVSHGSSACYVKLTFQVDEDTYDVMRSYGERQRDREATIARNGTEIANSQDAVTSTVERIIGMEQDVFEKSVFVAQGEIDDLVNEQPRKRKEFFSRMIGIEKLSNTATMLGEISRDVTSSISEAKGKLERLSVYRESLSRSLIEKERLSDELGKAADSIGEVVEEEKRLKDLLSSQREALAGLKGKSALLESRRSEYSRLASEVAAIEGSLKKHESMMNENRRIEENPLFIYHGEIMEASGSITRLVDLSKRKKEIVEAEKTFNDLTGQLSDLQKDHDLYAGYSEESAILTRTLKTLEPGNDRWKIASDRLALFLEEIKTVEARIKNLGPEVEKIFGSLDVDASTVSNRIEEIEKHIDDIGKRINAKKSELGSRNERKRELSSRIDQLRGKNVCPLCGSELSPDHIRRLHTDVQKSIETTLDEIGKTAAEISSLSTEQDKLRNLLARMRSRNVSDYIQGTENLRSRKQAVIETEKDLEKLEGEHAQYAATRKRLDELEILMDGARDKESRYALVATKLEAARQNLSKSSLSDIEEEIRRHEQALSNVESLTGLSINQKNVEESSSLYHRHSELATIAKEYNQLSLSVEEKRKLKTGLEEEIRGLQKDVAALEDLTGEVKRLDAEFDKVRGRHADLTSLVGSRRESISRIENEIEELKKNISELEATEKTVMAMKSSIETINRLRAAFGVDGIQKYLRQKASEFITNGTRQILSSFSLDFDDVLVNEDFDVSVQKNGLLELDALSGGERIALSIALRISISRFLDEEQRMNCFLMDEPTTYLDEERRANLRNILHYALGESEHMPQLILITHHAELISAGDAVFEVSKESGISRVLS